MGKKNTSTTVEVPKELNKYVMRLLNNTQGAEKTSEEIKNFLKKYVGNYHRAMNLMVPLIDEIDKKIDAIQERNFPDQAPAEFAVEMVMLDKELELHYGVMKPLYDLYKIIKQKDTEVFENGYQNCKKRSESFIENMAKKLKEK